MVHPPRRLSVGLIGEFGIENDEFCIENDERLYLK